MSKKPASINKTVSDPNRYGRRLILEEWQWCAVKNAIDDYRSGEKDSITVSILQQYGLYDNENECIDDDAVNFLYMRNA